MIPESVQNVIETVWQVLLAIPMTWRAGAIIGGIIVGAYLLLYAEFRLTTRLRQIGWKPMPGTHLVGDFVKWVVRLSRWALVLWLIGVVLWYAWLFASQTPLESYLDQEGEWWSAVKEFIRTGEWMVPSSTDKLPHTIVPTLTISPTPIPSRTPTRHPSTTSKSEVYHVVEAGDSLSEIAQRYQVTVQDLIEANKDAYPSLVTDPRTIRVGWRLRIPQR
ncbi:MAG: LysM domain-containing protein [Anaerolineae bacterium]